MAIVSKIIFRLGRKRLSAAQKRALAKAIKASALKRAKRSAIRGAKLTKRSAKFATRAAIKSKRINSRLKSVNNLVKVRSASAAKYQLKRSVAESKFKNPSIAARLTGLGLKNSELSFKRADAEFVRYNARLQKSLIKQMRLNRTLESINAKQTRFASKITKINANTARLKAEAAKYAKLSNSASKNPYYKV
jgi:hypothetical protein